MSTQHAISLLNIDENDLNFDLDDLNGNKDNESDSQYVPITKKPKTPSPSLQRHSFIELIKSSNHNDNKNAKTDQSKKNSIGEFEIHNQSLFDLFEVQNNDADKRSVIDMTSSTQVTQRNQNNKSKIFEFNQSSIVDQQILSPEKFDNSKLVDKIYVQNLNQDQIWLFAKDDVIDQLNSLNLNPNLLNKYSIKNCIYKVHKYCLLKNEIRTKNEVFRIPFAYGRITRIDKLAPSAVVYLQDDSSGLMCTISTSCTKRYSDYIAVGTVLAFESACIIRLSSSKSSYNIIIDLNNLISIYYLNTSIENEDDVSNNNAVCKPTTIETLKIKNLNLTELNKNIKQFEKSLNHVDPLSISTVSNNSINISSNNNKSSLKRPLNSNNSNYSKPSNSNSYDSNNNKNTLQNHAPVIYPSKSNLDIGKHTPETLKSNATTSSNTTCVTKTVNNTSSISSLRSFQFNKNKETSGTDITATENPHKTTNSSQSIALSQDVFSQLIFGIEDELLKDD